MSNLFPHGAGAQSSPGPRPDPPPPPDPPADPAPTPQTQGETWTVRGTTTGSGPCKVRIIAPDDRTIASAQLTKSGDYTIRVQGGISQVRVLHEGEQCRATGHARRTPGGAVLIEMNPSK